MIFRVRHATKYHYADGVDRAADLLHLRPRELPWQEVQSCAIRTSAAAGRWSEALDHFGNPVTHFSLEARHTALEIVTDSVVLMRKLPPMPDPAATPRWERVAVEAQHRPDVAEFAFASPMTPAIPPVRDWASASFPAGRAVLEGVCDLMARMMREFTLQPRVRTMLRDLPGLFEHRTGACQDFAHLMLAGLRARGLPARFVSGYLRTDAPPGTVRLRGADQLHAWIACWLGPNLGWVDLDPASGQAGEDHVWLAWGRDYTDVAPIRGVLCGGGQRTMSVSVDIERQSVPQTPQPVPLEALSFSL